MNKKIDNIGLMMIILTIVLLNIFIGSNIKQPIWIVQTIVSVFSLCYLIIKKVKKEKNVIIKGKIDILVLLFMMAVAIPYIAKTYVSLEGCCNFILKYWAVYGMYLLVRNIIVDDKKIKILLSSIVISSIIPIIFGFDKLTVNLLEPFYQLINAVAIEDTRMISTFGYANTFAVYLVLTESIAIALFSNTDNKKVKILYICYIIVAAITILLTQSKATFALIAITIFIFIIKGIKDKKITKNWMIAGVCFVILFFVYFWIAIQIDKPLKIEGEEKNCVIRGITPNTQYQFELDINAQTSKTYDTFEIMVVEVTRHFSERHLGRLSFANFNGIKTLNFQTSEYADHIEIRIANPLKQQLTINRLKINDIPYIIEYKIIPDELVRVFTTFNFKNSSVWQRVDYWRAGLEIVKDNWLLGAGGNTWRMQYGQVQDYLYYAKEAHSYPLEVWMSFGLLGIVSYIGILGITGYHTINRLKNSTQGSKKYKIMLAIGIGIGILVIHSFMDFDMSYLIIEMLFFTLIALLNEQDKTIEANTNIIENVIVLILAIISIGNLLGLTADLLEDETGITSHKIAGWVARYQYNQIVYLENNQIEDSNEINYLKRYIQNEPYQHQNTIYEIMGKQIIKSENISDIEFLINTWKNREVERKYEIKQLQIRAENMLEIAKQLMEKKVENNHQELQREAEEILNIIQQEYRKYRKFMLDYERNREGETSAQYKYQYYTNTYLEATKLLEKRKEI